MNTIVINKAIIESEIQIPMRIGLDGHTFTPEITTDEGDIILSFTNDAELPNPDPVVLNEGMPEAIEDIEALEILIAAAESARANAENLRVSAESARANAEGLRVLAEQARVTAEGLRVQAENTRVNTEGLRVIAENARVSAENLRVLAEQARVTAEGLRVVAESARVSAENLRVQAEQARVNAEGLRVTAENARVIAEGLRVTAEQGRVTAEGLRVIAENARVAAENLRAQAEIDRVNSGAALVTDVKLIQPAIAFYKRVIADSGTVGDRTILANLFTAKLKSLPTTQMLYFPHVGIKQRTSGLNKYASKVYDLGLSNIDAAQSTEATQSYTTVNAAPSSLVGLKYVSGQTQTGEIPFFDANGNPFTKTYLATDSWTFTIVLKANKITQANTRIYLGTTSRIILNPNAIYIADAGNILEATSVSALVSGMSLIIEFKYSNGLGLIKVNGQPVVTTTMSNAVAFSKIAYSSTYPFDGTIYFAHLQNERISEAESQQNYALLRAIIPEIEGVNIGNQHWGTSNYEGITDGAGNNIPEVQGATSVELITNAADRDFSLITGNWIVLNESEISGGVLNINSTGVKDYVRINIGLQNNKLYKVTFTINRTGGSFRFILGGSQASGYYSTTNTFVVYIYSTGLANAFLYLSGSGFIGTVDNISCQEIGWSDATAIYDARIAAGDTVKAAALAASMLSGYSNTAANMAIYGKLYNAYGARTIDYASPVNWRVPSYASWLQMATALGGITVAGGRLKKDTTVYFTTPNTGATNDSGFSAIANGLRGIDGTFASVGEQANFWTSDGYLVTLNYNAATITFTAGADPLIGAAIRLMRNEPVGNDMEVVSTGWFTTNIASTAKSILCKFGYFVRAINISTTPNITGIEAKLYNAAGSAVATLFTGKACNATTINFDVAVDQPELFQDGTVRVTATGNGATGTPPLGMKIEVIYGKTKKSV